MRNRSYYDKDEYWYVKIITLQNCLTYPLTNDEHTDTQFAQPLVYFSHLFHYPLDLSMTYPIDRLLSLCLSHFFHGRQHGGAQHSR